MGGWVVLVFVKDHGSLPVRYDSEQEAVAYAEIMSTMPHITSVELFKRTAIFKGYK